MTHEKFRASFLLVTELPGHLLQIFSQISGVITCQPIVSERSTLTNALALLAVTSPKFKNGVYKFVLIAVGPEVHVDHPLTLLVYFYARLTNVLRYSHRFHKVNGCNLAF